ncbi:phospholipase C type enzyme, variant 2 [Ascochyta rabiei]|uniref:phospholipase C type enzyme, variant 2 n=1 Tax=Didymella rabiei TaxID=5454 RepID=UPI00220F6E3B|nr:phospholipase C type enzyme, variant 2 [Ascochyta rabiei]UPX16720.1 phospholipase C type enzyme, variant 2 [Ascochyta rabiei]
MVASFRDLLGIRPGTASTSDSALIIIDAQNEYAEGQLKVTNAESSGKAIASLLEKYRAANGKIVHVMHQTPEGAPIFTPGTKLANEFSNVAAKVRVLTSFTRTHTDRVQDGEEVIWKQFPGSFEQTSLHDTLQSWGVKKVALTGYMAHVCVSTTAREAMQKGYEVILVEDAIGDRDIPGVEGSELTRVALAELADVFGTTVQSSDIR